MTEYQDLTESSSAVTGESRQWFVAKGLLSTSMDTLERRQRALISNCTLRKLLQHHRTMVTQELSDYVNLLGRTVEKPSKSLELVSETKSDNEVDPKDSSLRNPRLCGTWQKYSMKPEPLSISQP